MAKFQLWARDEYGQGSIYTTSEDINEIIKKAKEEVTDINVRNALTSSDRENNWEAYFVDIVNSSKKSKITYVYGSLDTHIKDRVYAISKDKVESITVSDIPKAKIRIYLGNVSANRKEEKDWIGEDLRVRPITTTDHADLKSKTIFFIKKV
jgi:hypothetical protein